jgi:glutaredoxin
MIERILILLGVVVAVVLIRAYMTYVSRRATTQTIDIPSDNRGKSGVIALSADGCVQCEKLQKPALTRLRIQRADLPVTHLRIEEHQDLVKKLGIFTVPTTIVHDASGAVRHVNLGYTDDVTLYNQLAVVSAPPHCL